MSIKPERSLSSAAPDRREIVRRVAARYFEQAEPEHQADFEKAFEAVYAEVEERLDDFEPDEIGRQFDPAWAAIPLVAAITWVAARLTRAAPASMRGEPRRLERRLDREEPILAVRLGIPESVRRIRKLMLEIYRELDALEQQGFQAGSAPRAPEAARPPAPSGSGGAAPVDLHIRVRLVSEGGWMRLDFELYSPSGAVDYHFKEIRGDSLKVTPEAFRRRLMRKIEKLHDGRDADSDLLHLEEVQKKLEKVGQDIYRELFPEEMRRAYRNFRDKVQTILITSQEPWIPWEMVKPFDRSDPNELIDDEFLCERFELARWLEGCPPPPDLIPVDRLACIEAADAGSLQPLPSARAERKLLSELARRWGVEDASLPSATWKEVEGLLERGGLQLIHFAGHGRFDPDQPDESPIPLRDGRSFRPGDLSGAIELQVAKNRPLVFFNACQVGQQSWHLTGLGGWAANWVQRCHCGGFVAPQWKVGDKSALHFARTFYRELEERSTFGRAVREARLEVKQLGKPGWLSYTSYVNPNGRLAGSAMRAIESVGC